MKTIKKKVEYQAISFPIDLVEKMKVYVRKTPQYRSLAEFARDAIQEKLSKEQQLSIDINKLPKETKE